MVVLLDKFDALHHDFLSLQVNVTGYITTNAMSVFDVI